jgi:hypothetical protein
MYSGPKDSDRVSSELPLKDLEKLVHRFTSLSKNNEVPCSCRMVPFSGSYALPKISSFSSSGVTIFLTFILLSLYTHLLCHFLISRSIGPPNSIFSSPLPEGGEVDGRIIVTTIHKNLFLRVKPQNPRDPRVPPKKKQGQTNNLSLAIPSPPSCNFSR